MSFFDDSHVTDVGMTGSAGPSVGVWDMVKQSWEQQFRVDSQQALQQEIHNRWLENLQAFERKTGQRLDAPDPEMGLGSYMRYLDRLEGNEPGFFDEFDLATKAGAQRLERADLTIRQLGDPELKSYQQIVQEVYAMQRETEERTMSMASRAGTAGTIGGFAGAAAGSFTTRDPLNIITLPVGGGGRTVAMRIATEMGVAGAVVAGTETAFVQPNRARAGLPERSLAFDVAAAMVGAGVIRGGIEGFGAGVRRFRGREDIVLDFDDDQLRQMFGDNVNSPRARAGDQALDDIQFVERNNPYGQGEAANARFIAELQDIHRVMGGEPQTAIARVLPPIPFEAIERAADFQIVKQQSPTIYAKLEEAQARVVELDERIAEATARFEDTDIVGAVRLVNEDAANKLAVLQQRVNDEMLPEPERIAADVEGQAIINRVGVDKIEKRFNEQSSRTRHEVQRLRASRRAANRQYREAYKAVEAEVEQVRAFQRAYKGQQQTDAVDLLGNATFGRPFIGPMLQHDYVASRVDAINSFHDTLDDKSAGMFERVKEGEGEEAVEREVWDTERGVNIGLRDPVDPNFRFVTDDGEMSVADAMRDLQDDADLEEAMRTCLL